MATTKFESDLRGDAGRDATTIGAVASDAMDKASEGLGSAAASAQEVMQVQRDKVESAIRRNPLAAAGIAAGIGFMMAVLARR